MMLGTLLRQGSVSEELLFSRAGESGQEGQSCTVG